MVGVMFVGALGVNATTLIAGTYAMKKGLYPYQYGITENSDFRKFNFISIDEMVFSGWDYFNIPISQKLNQYDVISEEILKKIPELNNIDLYKGIWTEKDIPIESGFDYLFIPNTVKEGVDEAKKNIQSFKSVKNLDTIVIVYLGSPSKSVAEGICSCSYEEFFNLPVTSIPSSIIYAVAAVECGAHFVDFTPSQTLEFSFLHSLAEKGNVQLSGRDGSTGQTMLKLVIADMLNIRGLHLDAWYSTNILGNHDGYVLSMPEYCETKISDKMTGIEQLLGYNDYEHVVTINYFKKRNDAKESWDSVDFSGWLGTEMSLKLNWQGEDAMLSAPIILDIIRFIEYGTKYHLKGLQYQLGLFYKHPYGCEGLSLSKMYQNLVKYYTILDSEER